MSFFRTARLEQGAQEPLTSEILNIRGARASFIKYISKVSYVLFCLVSMVTSHFSSDFRNRLTKFD